MSFKNRLRLEKRAQRKALDDETRLELDRAIKQNLLENFHYRAARVVLAYWSMPDEVETQEIVADAIDGGKVVLLPRCERGVGEFKIVRIDDPGEQLTPGPFRGLFQPRDDIPVWDGPGKLDLVLVPGLAFTPDGHRLGMGGGMYDRFLNSYPSAVRLALAYGFQVQEQLPVEEHDERVDWILTETGLITQEPNRYQREIAPYDHSSNVDFFK